jgi:hypothetical protein
MIATGIAAGCYFSPRRATAAARPVRAFFAGVARATRSTEPLVVAGELTAAATELALQDAPNQTGAS